jgi:predicted nucleic acid-binding protein
MIILDTNVLSELLRPEPARQVERWLSAQDGAKVYFTTVGEAELRYGVAILAAGKRRGARADAAASPAVAALRAQAAQLRAQLAGVTSEAPLLRVRPIAGDGRSQTVDSFAVPRAAADAGALAAAIRARRADPALPCAGDAADVEGGSSGGDAAIAASSAATAAAAGAPATPVPSEVTYLVGEGRLPFAADAAAGLRAVLGGTGGSSAASAATASVGGGEDAEAAELARLLYPPSAVTTCARRRTQPLGSPHARARARVPATSLRS